AGAACLSVRAADNAGSAATQPATNAVSTTSANTAMKPVSTRETRAKAKADRAAAKAKAKADKAAAAAAAKQEAERKAKAEQKEKAYANYAGKELGMKRINAPARPISTSKEEQLNALLDKYEADQISPEEYHKQRAEILAQP
ncbi:MAG TPA: hypothetical protein VF988_08070, partial [Verrucomicrobiae bacterium]